MRLPADFITRTQPLLKEEWEAFVSALQSESLVSIRLNKNKSMNLNHRLGDKVVWSERGYYLNKRPSFTFDPLFHAGCYYVQEASSMFVEQAVKQYVEGQVRFLDLCAAPGGKTTLVADLLSDDSLIVANEVIRSRSNILSENITKWGNDNIIVSNNDPADLGQLTDFFDVMLIDAPCSGEGMFRKDKGAIDEWSEDNVRLCKERQQRIVADVWPALKSGGTLIYSTCTYNKEENEDNVQWICDELGAEVLPLDVPEEWAIANSYTDGVSAFHFFPHKTKGEGFFLAVLRKKENHDSGSCYSRKKEKGGKQKNKKEIIPIEYKEHLFDSDSFTFYKQGDFWCAFPTVIFDDLNLLKSDLNIISAGICLGECKGKDFVPNQSLAMSKQLSPASFIKYEVDWKTAISYLRKEVQVIDCQYRGYVLLTYKDMPIGFVKNIGNRANNLYPQEWRIRSTNIPSEDVNVL